MARWQPGRNPDPDMQGTWIDRALVLYRRVFRRQLIPILVLMGTSLALSAFPLRAMMVLLQVLLWADWNGSTTSLSAPMLERTGLLLTDQAWSLWGWWALPLATLAPLVVGMAFVAVVVAATIKDDLLGRDESRNPLVLLGRYGLVTLGLVARRIAGLLLLIPVGAVSYWAFGAVPWYLALVLGILGLAGIVVGLHLAWNSQWAESVLVFEGGGVRDAVARGRILRARSRATEGWGGCSGLMLMAGVAYVLFWVAILTSPPLVFLQAAIQLWLLWALPFQCVQTTMDYLDRRAALEHLDLEMLMGGGDG